MSNCINILTDIVIPVKQINTINLFHDMEEINKLEDVGFGDDTTLKEHIIWWFLSERNVRIEGNDLIIHLGGHRSSHTQRDFNQVGYVLAEYVVLGALPKGEYIHCPVKVQDELDGFNETFTNILILKPFEVI